MGLNTAIEWPPGSFYENAFKKGDNPAIAVADFLKNNKNFIVDKDISNKQLVSSSYNGYLKRIK